MKEHINLNLKTTEEHSPLYYAYLKYELDQPHYADWLLGNGAQTDPLYSAHGCCDLLQKLVEGGAEKGAAHLAGHVRNLNHVDVEGETALHMACERGYGELVGKLVSLFWFFY